MPRLTDAPLEEAKRLAIERHGEPPSLLDLIPAEEPTPIEPIPAEFVAAAHAEVEEVV
jgi:hypothetical protein